MHAVSLYTIWSCDSLLLQPFHWQTVKLVIENILIIQVLRTGWVLFEATVITFWREFAATFHPTWWSCLLISSVRPTWPAQSGLSVNAEVRALGLARTRAVNILQWLQISSGHSLFLFVLQQPVCCLYMRLWLSKRYEMFIFSDTRHQASKVILCTWNFFSIT